MRSGNGSTAKGRGADRTRAGLSAKVNGSTLFGFSPLRFCSSFCSTVDTATNQVPDLRLRSGASDLQYAVIPFSGAPVSFCVSTVTFFPEAPRHTGSFPTLRPFARGGIYPDELRESRVNRQRTPNRQIRKLFRYGGHAEGRESSRKRKANRHPGPGRCSACVRRCQ